MPTLQAQAIALKAKLYRGFADPSRLLILETLREGSLPVNAIVEKTGLLRTNVSNHLGWSPHLLPVEPPQNCRPVSLD